MANGELCFREEFGTFWLWAYPSLLGWPLDVRWLFLPVGCTTEFTPAICGVSMKSASFSLLNRVWLGMRGRTLSLISSSYSAGETAPPSPQSREASRL